MKDLLKKYVLATLVIAGMIFLNFLDFNADRERYEERKAEMLQCDQEDLSTEVLDC